MTGPDDEDELDLTAIGTRTELAAELALKAKSQRPWLVVVSGSTSIGKMYRLERQILVGRAPQCDVHLDEEGVSRRHAMLERIEEGNVEIADLSSRNGTFVNGARISRLTLRDGDKIQIGGATILKFSYQDELDEALQHNLYESATRDALTHAINKRGFEETFAKEFAFARRHGRQLSLMAFDVDHFKRVNDTYGHAAGDHVLRKLAEVIAASIRTEDLLARVGGEEFVVLLRDIGLDNALDCADRLRRAVEQTVFEAEGTRIAVTISAGLAALDAAHASRHALAEAADRALYEAKGAGRNRVCVAGPSKRSG